MKRQRSLVGSEITRRLPATRKATKKKAKPRVGQGKEEEVADTANELVGNQVTRDDREFAEVVKAKEMLELEWEEWPCLWVAAVDEQMSWGTCWSPSWDMEFIDGEAYRALYSDVVWEDDLWDLKDIKDVPSP